MPFFLFERLDWVSYLKRNLNWCFSKWDEKILMYRIDIGSKDVFLKEYNDQLLMEYGLGIYGRKCLWLFGTKNTCLNRKQKFFGWHRCWSIRLASGAPLKQQLLYFGCSSINLTTDWHNSNNIFSCSTLETKDF